MSVLQSGAGYRGKIRGYVKNCLPVRCGSPRASEEKRARLSFAARYACCSESSEPKGAMAMITETAATDPLSTCGGDEHSLCARIRAEFDEMPGLNLTLQQAARLFGIDPARCA